MFKIAKYKNNFINKLEQLKNNLIVVNLLRVVIFLLNFAILLFIFKNIPYVGDSDSGVIQNFSGVASFSNVVKQQFYHCSLDSNKDPTFLILVQKITTPFIFEVKSSLFLINDFFFFKFNNIFSI